MQKPTRTPIEPQTETTGQTLDTTPCLQDDQLMEAILENLHSTPIGQVLKRIAQQTKIRKGKVFNVCRQLHDGSYDVDQRLDAVIDKVLEDLTG